MGASAASDGAGGDFRADGGRPVRVCGRAAVGPEETEGCGARAQEALTGHAAKRSSAHDDAIAEPEPTLEEVIAEQERDRLFAIIEDLVLWENTTNEEVLEPARREIWQSWRRTCAENAAHPRAAEIFDRHKLPAFHDPFAGGGALPLEAQRLGLEAHASDLNPVAVLINKAMIEIPPKFAGQAPVNPAVRQEKSLIERNWTGAQGLAEDVRYYGQWMRDEAEQRIGHLYPKVEVTEEMVKERPDLERYKGRKLTVIAWLWARTVKSPNPAFADVDVPLASTFMLSTKKGKEAYVEPVIRGTRVSVHGEGRRTAGCGHGEGWNEAVARGQLPVPDVGCRRCTFATTSGPREGQTGRMGARLMAIVAEGDRVVGSISPPLPIMMMAARQAHPDWTHRRLAICPEPISTSATSRHLRSGMNSCV